MKRRNLERWLSTSVVAWTVAMGAAIAAGTPSHMRIPSMHCDCLRQAVHIFLRTRPPGRSPKPASALLKTAEVQSAATGKPILVVFGASWCGYCHVLDNYLELPRIKPIFERNYIIVHLDVCEQGRGTAQENPGATQLIADWSANSQLPYCAVLNAKGYIIGDQTGYPCGPDQLPRFRQLLLATAPHLTASELNSIVNSLPQYLEQQAELHAHIHRSMD